jgi:hypothetical protein
MGDFNPLDFRGNGESVTVIAGLDEIEFEAKSNV